MTEEAQDRSRQSNKTLAAWGCLLVAIYVLSRAPAMVICLRMGPTSPTLAMCFDIFYWPMEMAFKSSPTFDKVYGDYARWWSRLLR